MSRRSKIHWKDGELESLKDLTSAFNKKVAAAKRRFPELKHVQPTTYSPNKLQNIGESRGRQSLKREINRMKRYLKEGAEQPVVLESGAATTEFQLAENKRTVQNINQYRRNIAKKVKEGASPERGTAAKAHRDIHDRMMKDKSQIVSGAKFEQYTQHIEEMLENYRTGYYDELYKQNYLSAVEANYGKNSPLYKTVEAMRAEDLVNMYYRDIITTIDFVYHSDDADARMARILDTFAEFGVEVKNSDGFTL